MPVLEQHLCLGNPPCKMWVTPPRYPLLHPSAPRVATEEARVRGEESTPAAARCAILSPAKRWTSTPSHLAAYQGLPRVKSQNLSCGDGDSDFLPPRGTERPHGTSHGRGDHSPGWQEARAPLSPQPKAPIPLSFSHRAGTEAAARIGLFDFAPTLCLCGKTKTKSDHKMGLKPSVYHGSRTPTAFSWCPVAFSFQMKMLCASEDLQ